MGLRSDVGRGLDRALGKQRADQVRLAERRARQRLAGAIAPRPPRGAAARDVAPTRSKHTSRLAPSDPFTPHPEPTITRHDLLQALHTNLTPRTYLEIGVNRGASLTLSRTRTVAVDPDFAVRQPVHCDLDLVQAESDAFFARPDALQHFDGVPVDLAFIDGMHLSEFALRDFMNVEKHLAPTGVAVFDDMLPRNALEAARVRRTTAWAGDVYKAVETIARLRPDLVVVLINTRPTGTAVVVGADPGSTVLAEAYDAEVPYLEQEDPQSPPADYLSRAAAVDPGVLLASEAWPLLVQGRQEGDPALVERAKDLLRALPRLG